MKGLGSPRRTSDRPDRASSWAKLYSTGRAASSGVPPGRRTLKGRPVLDFFMWVMYGSLQRVDEADGAWSCQAVEVPSRQVIKGVVDLDLWNLAL